MLTLLWRNSEIEMRASHPETRVYSLHPTRLLCQCYGVFVGVCVCFFSLSLALQSRGSCEPFGSVFAHIKSFAGPLLRLDKREYFTLTCRKAKTRCLDIVPLLDIINCVVKEQKRAQPEQLGLSLTELIIITIDGHNAILTPLSFFVL